MKLRGKTGSAFSEKEIFTTTVSWRPKAVFLLSRSLMAATKPQYSSGKRKMRKQKGRRKCPPSLPKKGGVESCTGGIRFVIGQHEEKLVRAVLRGGDERAALGKLKRGVGVYVHADSFRNMVAKVLHSGGCRELRKAYFKL